MASNPKAWIDRVTGGDSLRSIARKIGITNPTLSRQLSAQKLDPAITVAIARAYEANVIEGLVETGLIDMRDVAEVRDVTALRTASDAEIADEILRRLNERGTSNLGEKPAPREPLRLVTDDAPTDALDLPYAAGSSRDTGEEGDTP